MTPRTFLCAAALAEPRGGERMFREEMRVLGLPGAEDVTDGSVDYYDMDWENVENGVTEEQMAPWPTLLIRSTPSSPTTTAR